MTIELLGSPTFKNRGQPVEDFISAKAVALLCYIVSMPGPHSRERLAALLWGDLPDKRARGNLRVALHNLRRLLPDYVQSDRKTVRFRHDRPHQLDVDRLSQAQDRGDLEEIDALLGGARGPFLEGVELEEASPFTEWLLSRREQVRLQIMRALALLRDDRAAAGRWQDAVEIVRRRLAVESWRESDHRDLMKLLARAGDVEEALAQYERCRKLLAEAFGVAPRPETTALRERLHRLSRRSRHNLPPYELPLYGRGEEQARLTDWLRDRRVALVTLTGPGGSGKTRLAMETGRALVGHFLDGVYVVPMTMLERAAEAPRAVATQLAELGVFPELPAGADPLPHLETHLAELELLLILDNLEHLLADEAGLSPLLDLLNRLEAAPAITLLITSRERVHLQGERVLALDGIGCTGDAGQEGPAPALFRAAAGRHVGGGQLDTPGARRTIGAICRAVDGLPLALELAAAWAGTYPLEDIAEEIERNLAFLRNPRQTMPDRQRSIRAVLRHSWSLLAAPERELLSRLTVFRTPFSAEEARRVSGAGWQSLAALVDRSLLRVRGEKDTRRYDLHVLVHHFAAEKLQADTLAFHAARQAHADHFLAILADAGAQLRHGALRPHLLRARLPDLLAAWEWGVARRDVVALSGARDGLKTYFDLAGPYDRGVTVMTRALTYLTPPPDSDAGRRLHLRLRLNRSMLLSYSGDQKEGLREAEELVESTRRLGDGELLALALCQKGMILIRIGRSSDARPVLEEGRQVATSAGADRTLAVILQNLGNTALLKGAYDDAEPLYRQALEIGEALRLPSTVATLRHNLGYLQMERGHLEEAQALFLEARNGFTRLEYGKGLASCHHNLALVASRRGNYGSATAHYLDALALRRAVGDRPGEALTLANLALVERRAKGLRPALIRGQEALTLAQQTNERRAEAYAIHVLGFIAVDQGEYVTAWAYFERLLEIGLELESVDFEAYARRGFGYAALHTGRLQQAELFLRQAETLLEESGAAEMLSWTLGNRAEVALLRDALEEADGLLDRAQRSAKQAGAADALRYVRRLEAHRLRRTGHLEEALGRYEALGDEELAAGEGAPRLQTLAGLAAAALALDRVEVAQQAADEIATFLDEKAIDGATSAGFVFLHTFRALRVAGDGRAAGVLRRGQALIDRRAARLEDPEWRAAFQAMPEHRDLRNADVSDG